MEPRQRTNYFILPLLMCMILHLTFIETQSICPRRCLCHLDRTPRLILCSQQGLQQFPENISDVVEHIDLSRNELTEIPGNINRLIELEYLNLASNHLTSLPKVLVNLTRLWKLDLSGNEIRECQNLLSISQLTSLGILYLSNNPIKSLDDLVHPTLHALDASSCEIEQLASSSFEGLPSLETLSLVGNPLKIINEPASEKLRWLDLSDCHLNYLKPDTFAGLPQLEDLRLSHNPTLAYSSRHETLKHWNLRKLDVSSCNLDRPGLHGFPSLTHVKLSNNDIRILPDRIFARNRQLIHISLNSNGLEYLNKSTFAGLTKLQILDLSKNDLDHINWSMFRENLDLINLNLSYNNLKEFPNLTSTVTNLDVSWNLISNLKKHSLAYMPRLWNLNLSNNQLQDLPAYLQSFRLSVLNLKRNRLVQLKNQHFKKLSDLQVLDVSGNRLTEALSPDTFVNNPKLVVLRLEDNPWRCDCPRLFWLFKLVTDPSSNASSSTLICQSPMNVSGYTWQTACYAEWNKPYFNTNKERTWGFVIVTLLALTVLCGTITSIRHTMKNRRIAQEARRQLERAEVRERLRLLQRRNQVIEEDIENPMPPRIHPFEIEPPTYEEAVTMPRLTHSLDALDEISVEAVSLHVMGSVDNLRIKKRRTRRTRKRTQSEHNLSILEERRENRIRRRDRNLGRNQSTNDINEPHSRILPILNPINESRAINHLNNADDNTESGSGRRPPRPQTPSANRRKKRRIIIASNAGDPTDDEDSDAPGNAVPPSHGESRFVIRELNHEPRSGFRTQTQENT